jgi:hypothetical protein
MSSLDNVLPLSPGRFEAAKNTARDKVKAANRRPDPDDFKARVFSKYPDGLTAIMGIMLAIVGVVAFVISAGKMIISANMTLAPVIKDTTLVGEDWLRWVVYLSLIFGEVGTALFSFAAAIFPDAGKWRIFKWEFSPTAAIFRFSAVLCAGLAIAGNVGVSAMHSDAFKAVAFFGWGLTLFPPAAVIVVSLIGEKMILASLEARQESAMQFSRAFVEWERVDNNPEKADDYKQVFYTCLLDQLYRVSPRNKQAIEAAILADPSFPRQLIERELSRHNWIDSVQDRPTSPASIVPTGRPELSLLKS